MERNWQLCTNIQIVSVCHIPMTERTFVEIAEISKATQKIKKKYYCCTAWWVSGIIIQVYIAEKNCCSWEAENNDRVETNDDAGSRE